MGRPHTHTLALCSQGVVYAPFGNGFGFSLHPRSMGDKKKMIMKNDQTLYTNNTFFVLICTFVLFLLFFTILPDHTIQLARLFAFCLFLFSRLFASFEVHD